MKFLAIILILFLSNNSFAQPYSNNNLEFDSLTNRWDEGIPLGNGWMGALIWQKKNKLRLSLDRADLWDDRAMPEIDELKFNWVVDKVHLNQYDSVQKIGDVPYEKYAAPTKIPAAAIEFDLDKLGRVISNVLEINKGLSIIKFADGTILKNYIHAEKQVGYFTLEHTNNTLLPELIIPNYFGGNVGIMGNSVNGQGLERLGYAKGKIIKKFNSILYHQPTWQNNYYEVLVCWQKMSNNIMAGQWTITYNQPARLPFCKNYSELTNNLNSHIKWWSNFWSRSSISIPDSILQRQYYLEMYKFGCVARPNSPPISLQAIWTADNGTLPPWKGDLHHDLNTELSYWPGYTSNHLDLTASFTNWLWDVKNENKKWTKSYFGIDGLNVPGVTTISGKPMGGWIQYSMSPTMVAWLSQNFYWQWKYSMDENFLKNRCFPYFKEAEKYLSKILKWDSTSHTYQLPLSSSPEYYNNSISAWFKKYTNYDLALLYYFFNKSSEIYARVKGETYIFSTKKILPAFSVNETGLTIAPGQNLDESHRHHAHLMAIYPLGLVNVDIESQKEIIDKSLSWLAKKGTRQWTGYSFSWAACIYARSNYADSAVSMLHKFVSNFCSINSFHLNGDQKSGQYSNLTYRPFTLEGNFAYAQGIHELLLRDDNGYIEIFPAIPSSWLNVSFKNLRTKGAFLISAIKENGVITKVKIIAEQGGSLNFKLPFKTWICRGINSREIQLKDNIASANLKKGQTIIFENAYE